MRRELGHVTRETIGNHSARFHILGVSALDASGQVAMLSTTHDHVFLLLADVISELSA